MISIGVNIYETDERIDACGLVSGGVCVNIGPLAIWLLKPEQARELIERLQAALPPAVPAPPPIHAPGLDGLRLCPLCLQTHGEACPHSTEPPPVEREPNPFEPPETQRQQSARVGAMIRANVDDRLAQPIVRAHAEPDLETDLRSEGE